MSPQKRKTVFSISPQTIQMHKLELAEALKREENHKLIQNTPNINYAFSNTERSV